MKKQNIIEILNILDEIYGTKKICYLNYETPWQLLIAVILSAQCTDNRVNQVTKELFVKYDSLNAFANASHKELEADIYSIGFHKNKSKNIISTCKKLINDFDGKVPNTLDELLYLDGVGRKTANVILGNIYDIPSIVVDTHVKRISNRLGLTKETNPEKIEYDLMSILPQEHWILFNIQIISFGREICYAKNPKCNECKLRNYCEYDKK